MVMVMVRWKCQHVNVFAMKSLNMLNYLPRYFINSCILVHINESILNETLFDRSFDTKSVQFDEGQLTVGWVQHWWSECAQPPKGIFRDILKNPKPFQFSLNSEFMFFFFNCLLANVVSHHKHRSSPDDQKVSTIYLFLQVKLQRLEDRRLNFHLKPENGKM